MQNTGNLPQHKSSVWGKQFVSKHWQLLAIFVLHLALSAVYAWLIPPFEGPDESQHFAYIQWLAQENDFPPQGEAAWETAIEQEAGQPPLYYLMASIPARFIDLENPPAVFRPNPYFIAPLPREVPDHDNRAIHYPSDGSPLEGGWLAFYLARAITILSSLILLGSIYGLSYQVLPKNHYFALSATFLVAVIPQVIYIGSMVSNDIPVAAFSTLTLYLLAVMIRQGPSRKRAAGVGIAFGLAILCKISALTLGLSIGAAFIWLWYSRRLTLRQTVTSGGWLALSTFLVAGWWFIRVWRLYGSPLGIETHDLTPWVISNPEMLSGFWLRWLDVQRSFWVALGWGTIRPENWIYQGLFFLTLLSLAGWVVAGRQWWQNNRRGAASKKIAILVLLFLALLAVAIFLEWWMRRVIAPYGRLLYPAIGSITVFLVLGWYRLHPKLPLIPLGFVGGLAVLTPFLLIQPAYGPPDMLSQEEIAALPPNLGWQYKEPDGQLIAELLTVTPEKQSVNPDTILPIQVCWRALAETEHDYTILLHVIGPENSLVVNRRAYPGQGLYPTSIWQTGDAFCDLMHLPIWHEQKKTRVYYLEIALYDTVRKERLLAYDQFGNPLATTFVDRIRLIGFDAADQKPLSLSPDSTIQLVDYDLSTIWHLSQENPLTLSWATGSKLDQDYQVFVHLRDPITGENAAQADGPPLDGWYPTSWWPVNELIVDERQFFLPPELEPGSYKLFVGFYDLVSGERFGDEYFLDTVEVVP